MIEETGCRYLPEADDVPSLAVPPNRGAARLGLAAICCGFLIITVDATIVNVALGPIVEDLGGSLSGAQWIVSAYMLAFATFLLSAGAWSDRIGSKRAFLIGLALFGVASAGCAAAPTMAALIVARAVQGLGAALLMPCSLALITHMFPAGAPRRGALAAWGGISAVGMVAGPVLGGALVDGIGWRTIFVVNLPIAVVAALGIGAYVAETPRHRHPFDLSGQVLVVTALGGLSGGFIAAGSAGWGAPETIGLLALGALAVLAFWRVERTVPQPMIPPELFRNRRFSVVVGIAGIFNFSMYGTLFCLSLLYHEKLGLSPFATGLALLPLLGVIVVIAFASARLIGRLGEWRSMVVGFSGGAAGAVLLAVFGGNSTVATMICTVPFGTVALAMQAMTALAMEGAPVERIGLASGIQNAARQAGGALGVALLGTLLSATGTLALHLPLSVVAAFYLVALALAVRGWSAARAVRAAPDAELL
ncbi:MAG TPA: MFS transporter [Hyphomicrobiales bacterium]|nr:MFS transporter [Hyphomicrobiales bacterium]